MRWLTIALVLIAAAVIAGPVNTNSKVRIVLSLEATPIDTYERIVPADHAADSLITGRDDSAIVVATSDRTNTALIQTNAAHSSERFRERNANPDGCSDPLDTYTVPDLSVKPQPNDFKLAPEDIGDESGSTEYKYGDSSLIQQATDTKLARTTMGYHNYALVCADSKVHTDFCLNGRRGYYCSQNGYVQIITGGTRYLPCEEHCVCINIGVKPACVQFYAGPGTVTCPVKDET